MNMHIPLSNNSILFSKMAKFIDKCYLLKTLNSLINLQLDVLGLEETVTKKIWRAKRQMKLSHLSFLSFSDIPVR